MENILLFLQGYITYFPLTIFFALILGGFNLPVSEDLLIITSALLVKNDKSLLIPTLLSLYIGAILSDAMVYLWGALTARGFSSFSFINNLSDPKKSGRIAKKVKKHAFITNLLCRFIPFGVRNAFFLYMGVSKSNFLKFIIFDSISALISISSLFWVIYLLGQGGSRFIKIFALIAFLVLVAIAIWFLFISKDKEIEKEENPN